MQASHKVAEAMYEGVDFKLEPGDKLIIPSGGFANCLNKDGKPFGESRLATLLITSNGGSLDSTLRVAKSVLGRWCEGNTQNDDISVLAIERRQND